MTSQNVYVIYRDWFQSLKNYLKNRKTQNHNEKLNTDWYKKNMKFNNWPRFTPKNKIQTVKCRGKTLKS